jgi:hypothetical protein
MTVLLIYAILVTPALGFALRGSWKYSATFFSIFVAIYGIVTLLISDGCHNSVMFNLDSTDDDTNCSFISYLNPLKQVGLSKQ